MLLFSGAEKKVRGILEIPRVAGFSFRSLHRSSVTDRWMGIIRVYDRLKTLTLAQHYIILTVGPIRIPAFHSPGSKPQI